MGNISSPTSPLDMVCPNNFPKQLAITVNQNLNDNELLNNNAMTPQNEATTSDLFPPQDNEVARESLSEADESSNHTEGASAHPQRISRANPSTTMNPSATSNPFTTMNPSTTMKPSTTTNPSTTINPSTTMNHSTTMNPSTTMNFSTTAKNSSNKTKPKIILSKYNSCPTNSGHLKKLYNKGQISFHNSHGMSSMFCLKYFQNYNKNQKLESKSAVSKATILDPKTLHSGSSR